jgi:hypothetical protein
MNPRLSVIAGFLVIFGVIGLFFFFATSGPDSQETSIREVPLSFNSSYLVPVYSGSFGPNGSVDQISDPHDPQTGITPHRDIPTEQDAPFVAKKVMERFGGIPEDAVLSKVFIDYYTLHEPSNASGMPLAIQVNDSTVIQYKRMTVNGIPFLGRDFIDLTLLDKEKIKNLWIQWRTHSPAGNACIISPEEATKRLLGGKFVRTPADHYLVNVTRVDLAYYYANYTWYGPAVLKDIPTIPVEPVWVFNGKDSEGHSFSIHVPAIDTDISSTRCSGMRPIKPVRLNFTLEQPVIIDTSGMVSIEAAKKKVRDFLEEPDAIVEYKGMIVGHQGPYREFGFRQYVYYVFSVNGVEIRVDKLTGNVVLADYTHVYPNATNFTISLEQAKAIAMDFAARKYPEFNNANVQLKRSETLTPGVYSKNNVYRFIWFGSVDTDSTYSLIIQVHPENGKILLYEDNGRNYDDSFTVTYMETMIP